MMLWLDGLTEALVAVAPAADAETVQQLAELLEHKSQQVVSAACRALAQVQSSRDLAEPKLIRIAQSTNQSIKVDALCALAKTKPPTPAAVAAIRAALEDSRLGICACALDLLADLNVGEPSVVQAIVTVLQECRTENTDPKHLLNFLNPPLSWAEREKTQPNWEYYLPGTLDRPSPSAGSHVRLRALRALAAIRPQNSDVRRVVFTIANDDTDPLRLEAAVTALKLGMPCEEVLPPLIRGMDSPIEDIRRLAIEELKRIAGDCSQVAVGLARGLEDPNLTVRATAVRTLSDLGTNALPALPALEKAMRDPKIAVREPAKRLVEQLRTVKPKPL